MVVHETYFVYSYVNLLCTWGISLAISLMFVGICYLISGIDRNTTNTSDKLSAYECGFDPFSDAREPFNVKFYLLAVLFLIFDVEVCFFFPFAISIRVLPVIGVCSMYVFVLLLVVGFLYEWRKGCLDWA